MRRFIKVLVCLTLGLMTARAAAAAPVTVNFTFEVDKVNDHKQLMLGGDVKKGDLLNGTITFDSAAADEDAQSDWGFYSFQNPYAFTVLSPTPVVSDEFFVQVQNGPEDHLWVSGLETNVPGLSLGHMFIEMNDSAGSLWNSDALALTSLDASRLASLGAAFSMLMWEDGDIRHELAGRLVAFSTDAPGPQPPSVPEPTSMLLLGTGLIGVARLHRKRSVSPKA